MHNHEHYQELSALSAIGQLHSQEEHELAEHLQECEHCSAIHLEYSRVVQQQLPLAERMPWLLDWRLDGSALDPEIRERFVKRAQVDGIVFSEEAKRMEGVRSSSMWGSFQLWPAVAVAGLAVFAILVPWFGQRHSLAPPVTTATATIDAGAAQVARENDELRNQVAALQQAMQQENAKAAQADKEYASSLDSQRKLQQQLEAAQMQLDKVSAILQKTESDKDELANSGRSESATVANLRAQNDALDREKADLLSSRIVLETQTRELNAALQEKTADLERERQLMAVSKDVRQLMGARNLHILDVHDVNGGGKAAKAFGRVFYAEGQSLIFYAFDLPSGGRNAGKYTFQAWGQHEPRAQSVRNLGTFEVDDHEQRRWVLKVNDPSLLAGIDSVFVTSEPLRDSKEPRGNKLMYAYISGQPNHP
jgi:hypothetical protein